VALGNLTIIFNITTSGKYVWRFPNTSLETDLLANRRLPIDLITWDLEEAEWEVGNCPLGEGLVNPGTRTAVHSHSNAPGFILADGRESRSL
jgi:hypothetical protein